MAYMCLLQFLPRKARRYLPLGQYSFLSTESNLRGKEQTDLCSRVAIVTGANSGVGLAIAHALSSRGAIVILACRRAPAGEEAARLISRSTSGRVLFLQCDLESVASVNEFVASFIRLKLPLHLLFCNAGQMLSPFRYHTLASNGYEKQFASNHLGHFHLVNRLLGLMEACSSPAAPCRIISTASLAHWGACEYPRAAVEAAAASSRWFSYSESKLMNILFTRALARRLTVLAPRRVFCSCFHPGIVQSGLWRYLPWPFGALATLLPLRSPQTAAETAVHLATCRPEEAAAGHGDYFEDSAVSATLACCRDEAAQEHLWACSQRLCDLAAK